MNAQQLIKLLKLTEDPDSAWVTELIERGPVAGEEGGRHRWFYRAARAMYLYKYRNGLTKGEIFTIIRAKADVCGRDVPDSEIENAINNAVRQADEPKDESQKRQGATPKPDYEKIDEIVRAGFGIRELKAASPVNLAANPVTSDQIVSCLFPGEGLICAGRDAKSVITKPLSAWLKGESWLNEKLSQQAYIVPNRMSRLQGINQKGTLSSRCLDNTGPPRISRDRI